jgi:hypothetical protein
VIFDEDALPPLASGESDGERKGVEGSDINDVDIEVIVVARISADESCGGSERIGHKQETGVTVPSEDVENNFTKSSSSVFEENCKYFILYDEPSITPFNILNVVVDKMMSILDEDDSEILLGCVSKCSGGSRPRESFETYMDKILDPDS